MILQDFKPLHHTFIDDLDNAQIQDSLIKRMVGHDDGAVTFGVYGSRIPIKAMLVAIQNFHSDFEK